MFRAAVVRLTLWYLAVIMLLSVGFSIWIYNVSGNEFGALQARQQELFQGNRFGVPGNFTQFNRLQQIDQSEENIATNLIYFNLIILLGGGTLSYFLAKRTLRPIEEAMEAQNRFTADASHELRTPLTAMRTELEVALRDRELKLAESKDLHKSNLEEIEKLENLTNGLLKLAKQDGADVHFKTLSLESLVTDAIKQVDSRAAKRKIALTANIVDGKFKGDAWALTELIAILLDNAIKYSPAGTEVLISAEVNRQHASISVQDHGAGMKASDLPYIFNRFYRVDASRSKEKVDGYGLGLSIAKQIADTHKGVIAVKSKLGEGSIFTVTLPIDPKKVLAGKSIL